MRILFALFLIASTYSSAAELVVAAASDLSRLGPDLAEAYQRVNGATIRFSYGSSGSLARQIENGAPFDVFLSANQEFVNEGLKNGWLRRGSDRVYAVGHLAVWSRSGGFRKLDDLRAASVLHVAIANPALAPYGAAAKQALERAGLWEAVRGKLVYGENIRQALQFAESGNAEAAIVSWSLVFDQRGVRLPDGSYDPIRQAGAVTTRSSQPGEAARFLEFLRSATGRAVLSRYGLDAR